MTDDEQGEYEDVILRLNARIAELEQANSALRKTIDIKNARIAELETRTEYAEKEEEAAVEARLLLAYDLHREKAKVAELEAERDRLRNAIQQAARLTDELYTGAETAKGMMTIYNFLKANRILRAAIDAAKEG